MAEKSLRILHIHPFLRGDGINPRAGGKSRLSLQLSRSIATAGHAVAIFPFPEVLLERAYTVENGPAPLRLLPTAQLPAWKDQPELWWKALRLPLKDRSLRVLRMHTLFLAGLRKAVQDFQPDVIHNHDCFSDFPLLYAALNLRRPFVLTHHAPSPGEHLDMYQRIICTSKHMQRWICEGHPERMDRTRLIRPSVRDLFGDPAIPVTGRRRGLIFIGRLRLDKGLQHLLAAYAAEPALRKIPLRVCGEGSDKEHFMEIVRDRRLPVEFLGRLPPERIRAELLAAELMVNSSSGEGFSIALMEAMCCGVPAIGWKPQIEETQELLGMECGSGFDPEESRPEELAQKILAWRKQPRNRSVAYRKQLAGRSRTCFSIQRYTRETLSVISELL